MIATLGTAALIGSIVATAMASGLLYSFAHSVMPGLGSLDDREFLTAFQRIDAAIYNPWMMVTFVGSPVLTAAALALHLADGSGAAPWLVVALVLTLATVVITGAVHLPLNAATQDAAPEFRDAAGLRTRFEKRWVRWNVARTVTSVGSLGALCGALLGQ